MPDIDRCYEDWLKSQPSLGGRMTVQFTIDAEDGLEGHVSRVGIVDGGVGNIAFEGCVLSVVSELRFEPPMNGSVEVTYPCAFVAPPTAPEDLQSELASLCQRIRGEAQRAELSNVPLDELLTVVLANLTQQTPALAGYIEALLPADVPPVQRRETFKRAISTAIRAPWVCPDFDALWNGKHLSP